VTGIRGRRRKLLLYLMDTRRYWKLKEEALGRTLSRTRFGKVCGPVIRQTTWWWWWWWWWWWHWQLFRCYNRDGECFLGGTDGMFKCT